MNYIVAYYVDINVDDVVSMGYKSYIQDSLLDDGKNYKFNIQISENETHTEILNKWNGKSGYIVDELDISIEPDADNNITVKKLLMCKNIDSKTNQLIYNTLVAWPPQEPIAHFSLSEQAQRNWIGLMIVCNSIIYPYHVSCMEGEYGFSNAAEYQSFYFYGLGLIASKISGGRAIKAQINNSTTIEALNTIVDDRT